MARIENAFGKSMSIDLYGCDVYKIDNPTFILIVMEELIDHILKMERFGAPFLERFGKDDLQGYSYCQMIQTSCVTGHFAPYTGCAYIDVFSCADYEENEVDRYLIEAFEAKEGIRHVTLRR